jgi:Chromo (CHRromatin Organisation MOdifier) domain
MDEQNQEVKKKKKTSIAFYAIETLFGFRLNHSQPEYLIKWKGFPTSQNTWEPIQHFLYSLDLIEAYNKEKNINIDINTYINHDNKPLFYSNKVFANQAVTINKKPKKKPKRPHCDTPPVEKSITEEPIEKLKIIGLSYIVTIGLTKME